MASTSEYWVGEVIGEGSFGVVVYGRYKQADLREQSGPLHVAIKCMDKNSLHKQPSIAMAVIQEQRLLKRLKEKQQHDAAQEEEPKSEKSTTNSSTNLKNDNSNNFIVDLYASFHDTECVYLVLECCYGGTLQELLDHYRSIPVSKNESDSHNVVPAPDIDDSAALTFPTTKLLLEMTQYYGIQLVMGISFIHTRSIIHCDIKPSNILLTNFGSIKISDFGSAIDLLSNNSNKPKTSVVNNSKGSSASSTPTKSSGRMMIARGTAAYAAPELNRQAELQPPEQPVQRNGDDIDNYLSPTVAVDLWSLGCILYACLLTESHHQSPFDKGSEVASIQSQKDYCDTMETNGRYTTLFGTDSRNLVHDVNSKNDTTDKVEGLIKDFKCMIAALLSPKADDRITFATSLVQQQPELSSVANVDANYIMLYPKLQRNVVWNVDEVAQQQPLPLRTDFLPPTPSWWIKNSGAIAPTTTTGTTKPTTASQDTSETTTTNVLLDGAIGWSAFLV